MTSHTQIPLVDPIAPDIHRIYFGTRDDHNRSVVAYIEVSTADPSTVLYVHDKPALDLGELGCFDDSGVVPAWIVNHHGAKYLYYTGWNVGTTVPYRKAIGVAVSHDGGRTFRRLYSGPIADRTFSEPHFCAVPCVFVEGTRWRMWYLSCVRWEQYNGRTEPHYHIKYAESTDGITWDRTGAVAIDSKKPGEGGIGRPCVVREAGIYKMWYSYREGPDILMNKERSYRIGYAESDDGITWTRMDEVSGIDVAQSGWDSEMIAYPYVLCNNNGSAYLFYNGNGFGRSGVGYAVRSRVSMTGR